ncbi:TFIIA-alpha and beta-like factor isoform X5 [Lissotriton helveticus]
MQSKATEGFFRENHSSTQFVLQLPQNLHQTLQTSTASLVIPTGRNVHNFSSAELRTSRSSTTFTLPPGISYPIHVPAGVTLQTASGHMYKVNVPVMVTQTPGGPRILQHQQLFQHLGASSFQTAVTQPNSTSELGPRKPLQQEPFHRLANDLQFQPQKDIANDRILENSTVDQLKHQYPGFKLHNPMNVNLGKENCALEEPSLLNAHPALSKLPELSLGGETVPESNGISSPCESIQEHLNEAPDNTVELIVIGESGSLNRQSISSLPAEEVPSVGGKMHVQNTFDIIQIDGAGDTSSDEEIGTVRDLEENEFLGIIDTEDLKALEGDSVSNDDSTSNSSDDEDDQIDAIEEDPLNSGDDVSEQEVPDLFDTDNVIVCQYDKIHRSKNKWKFYLKDGVMSFGGKDYVFSKAIGEAEWRFQQPGFLRRSSWLTTSDERGELEVDRGLRYAWNPVIGGLAWTLCTWTLYC